LKHPRLYAQEEANVDQKNERERKMVLSRARERMQEAPNLAFVAQVEEMVMVREHAIVRIKRA
jgi:hypothetical protein